MCSSLHLADWVCSNGNRINPLCARERKVVTELSCTREPRADGLAHRGLCLQMRAATNADIATAADWILVPERRIYHTQPSNNLLPMLACFRGILFFFPTFLPSISHTHTFLDGVDGSTCLVRIPKERSITFNRNKEEKRMKRQKKKMSGTTTNTPQPPPVLTLTEIFYFQTSPLLITNP